MIPTPKHEFNASDVLQHATCGSWLRQEMQWVGIFAVWCSSLLCRFFVMNLQHEKEAICNCGMNMFCQGLSSHLAASFDSTCSNISYLIWSGTNRNWQAKIKLFCWISFSFVEIALSQSCICAHELCTCHSGMIPMLRSTLSRWWDRSESKITWEQGNVVKEHQWDVAVVPSFECWRVHVYEWLYR